MREMRASAMRDLLLIPHPTLAILELPLISSASRLTHELRTEMTSEVSPSGVDGHVGSGSHKHENTS